MTQADHFAFPFPAPSLPEPPPQFALLRERPGLAEVELPTGDRAWLVTRYRDVRAMLADPAFSRAATTRPEAPRLGPARPEPASMMAMDPPEHTRLRRLVAPEFSSGRVERLRPWLERSTAGLVEAIVRAGPPADLVAGLAEPLPLLTICKLLGVSDGDLAEFVRLIEASLRIAPEQREEVESARSRLREALAELVARKRAAPGDDVLSSLTRHRAEGRLDDEELVALGVTILTAGYHPVRNALANGLLVLLSRPGDLDRLRERPELLPTAVEELLRYTPGPVSGGTIRVAVRDTWLGGTRVCAGEAVIPAIASANRDPSVFADADRLDLARQPNPHIAFGPGIHHCLGASVARAELTVALATLLRRLPGLRLAVAADELRWSGGTMIRGIEELPVRW
ncbi:cytochrome P450 [Dactylosporangium fulvum]|uniref:Cytochrome P450 n=1 Tax=Dactylosporangium fulvum TaxID=53359 RepID=A0ABY5WAR8_9ACTN|nr:cytochrome P450 [Dactylosporangium fulvum]UWP86114.1 cytochrome P450 [Dactylosporangium fulvum]